MTRYVSLARRNNFATRAGWRRLRKQGTMLPPRTKFYICSLFQFVDVESAITSIVDRFAHKLRRGHRKELFSLMTCCLMFLLGLSMVTEVCNVNSENNVIPFSISSIVFDGAYWSSSAQWIHDPLTDQTHPAWCSLTSFSLPSDSLPRSLFLSRHGCRVAGERRRISGRRFCPPEKQAVRKTEK